MKKLIFFLGLAIFMSEIAFAQKELNNWFFGNNAGLNFGSGAPVFAPGSALVSEAGCSSVSDKQGNLLFYTNGVTVWNRNHQPMPNGTGLNGDIGSTQTVLITYYPGNEDLYYVFTVDKAGGPRGLRSSVVNMKLDGGLGDIDVSQNQDFALPTSEKLTAVKHGNGINLWLIVPMYNSNIFFVYAIDCKGLLAFPKVYSVGSVMNSAGYLKASPDGKKLVTANFAGDFEIFDFNNTTGDITNPQVIPSSSPGLKCGPYGVEFSPDSKLLYLGEAFTCKPASTFNICQYRLDPNIANTIASRVLLDAGNTNISGALQLGPDNKIYITYDGANYLGVINSPNTEGSGCNLAKQSLLVPPASGSFGLPNVIAGFKRTALVEDTTVCDGAPLALKLNLPATTYLWNDGSTADSLVVSKSGKYWVDLIATNENGSTCPLTDTINVTFQSAPKFSLGNDTTICQAKFPLLLTASVPGASFLWQDSSTKASYSATGQGVYWLQATASGCSSRDSIEITSTTGTPFNLGADTALCPGDSLTLTANVTATKYLWSTLASSKSIVAKTGIYWCEVTYANGCTYRDSITITGKSAPTVDLGKDTTVCQNQFPLPLSQSIPGAAYLWQDGSTGNIFSVPAAGTYWVQATVNGCASRDSIKVGATILTTFSLGPDTSICSTAPVTLTAKATAASYLWNTGSTSQSITINNSGDYWCEINRGTGCSYSDTIKVTFAAPIVFSLGKDTVLCQNTSLLLNVSNTGDSYLWQDNSTQPQFQVTKSGTYYVTVTKGNCSKADTIAVTYGEPLKPDLGVDRSICPGEQILLDAKVPGTSYLWQDGTTNKTFRVTSPGTYSVQVFNQCGSAVDEIVIGTGSCKLMVPNAFTPGKSTNSLFRILNAAELKDFTLQVFNRWGQQVYQTSKPAEGWNGRYNGVEQPAETYVYIVSYTDIVTGRKISQKGTVILVR